MKESVWKGIPKFITATERLIDSAQLITERQLQLSAILLYAASVISQYQQFWDEFGRQRRSQSDRHSEKQKNLIAAAHDSQNTSRTLYEGTYENGVSKLIFCQNQINNFNQTIRHSWRARARALSVFLSVSMSICLFLSRLYFYLPSFCFLYMS